MDLDLTLTQRLHALSQNEKIMLPQNFYEEYYYVSEDDELCDSSGEKVEDEEIMGLLFDDCSICWLVNENNMQENIELAKELYHND